MNRLTASTALTKWCVVTVRTVRGLVRDARALTIRLKPAGLTTAGCSARPRSGYSSLGGTAWHKKLIVSRKRKRKRQGQRGQNGVMARTRSIIAAG